MKNVRKEKKHRIRGINMFDQNSRKRENGEETQFEEKLMAFSRTNGKPTTAIYWHQEIYLRERVETATKYKTTETACMR